LGRRRDERPARRRSGTAVHEGVIERIAADDLGLEIVRTGPEGTRVRGAQPLTVENALRPAEGDVVQIGHAAVRAVEESGQRIAPESRRAAHAIEGIYHEQTP